jgi:hypothetical protein
VKVAHYLVAGLSALALGAVLVLFPTWLTSSAAGGGVKPHPALFLLAPMVVAAKFGVSREVGLLLTFALYSASCFVCLLFYIRGGGTVGR